MRSGAGNVNGRAFVAHGVQLEPAQDGRALPRARPRVEVFHVDLPFGGHARLRAGAGASSEVDPVLRRVDGMLERAEEAAAGL
jgi:hypothetical protein